MSERPVHPVHIPCIMEDRAEISRISVAEIPNAIRSQRMKFPWTRLSGHELFSDIIDKSELVHLDFLVDAKSIT